jgi:hypothetical protein
MEDYIKVGLFNESMASPYADLLKDMGEVIIYGVFGDVEDLRDLLGGGPANGQVGHFLLAGAQPIADRGQGEYFFWPGRRDDHNRLGGARVGQLGS